MPNVLNPTLHISPPSSFGSALGLKSKGRSFEPAVNHYFSSNNVRLLAYVFTGEDPQTEWLKHDESKSSILVSDKILNWSICVGCFYHKGPALTREHSFKCAVLVTSSVCWYFILTSAMIFDLVQDSIWKQKKTFVVFLQYWWWIVI